MHYISCTSSLFTVFIVHSLFDERWGYSRHYIYTLLDYRWEQLYSLISLIFSATFQDVQLKASSLPAVVQPALPPVPTLTPSVHGSVCLAVSVPRGRCSATERKSVSFSSSASINCSNTHQ